MVKLIETCSFLCRHWMSCLWMLKQLKRVTVLVLIRQGCQGYMDCQHHRCILRAVLGIRIQRLQKTRSHESLLTQGSFSHHFMVMQILMEVDALTCQVSIRQWMHKAFEFAVYWSMSYWQCLINNYKAYIHLTALSNFGDGWNSTCQGWLKARFWYCFHLYIFLFCSSNII